MDVTIDYLTCTEYVKLRPQQFFGITLYWALSTFFTGTVFIIIFGFQIIAELKWDKKLKYKTAIMSTCSVHSMKVCQKNIHFHVNNNIRNNNKNWIFNQKCKS